MHSTHLIVAGAALAAAAAFTLGFIVAGIIARERDHLDALQLAERADTNGRRLLAIARELRAMASDQRRDYAAWPALATEWAADLEAAAAAHLQCINAIGLDQLHAVGYPEPWLGEFVPARNANATPSDSAGPAPGPIARALMPESAAAASASPDEPCESGAPDCGPATHYDADLTPLCDRCYAALPRGGAGSVANG